MYPKPQKFPNVRKRMRRRWFVFTKLSFDDIISSVNDSVCISCSSASNLWWDTDLNFNYYDFYSLCFEDVVIESEGSDNSLDGVESNENVLTGSEDDGDYLDECEYNRDAISGGEDDGDALAGGEDNKFTDSARIDMNVKVIAANMKDENDKPCLLQNEEGEEEKEQVHPL